MGWISRCLFLALFLLGEGCWTQSRRLDQTTPIRREDTVWIWSGGKAVRWHDVVIEPDSITGIPYNSPLGCDCRRAIPRTEVDSIVDIHRGVTQYVVGAVLIYAFFRWYVFNPNIR